MKELEAQLATERAEPDRQPHAIAERGGRDRDLAVAVGARWIAVEGRF